jgi:hypothetical protein
MMPNLINSSLPPAKFAIDKLLWIHPLAGAYRISPTPNLTTEALGSGIVPSHVFGEALACLNHNTNPSKRRPSCPIPN